MPGKKTPGPSVKDDRRYEALRREGASKEKAARIANTDPKEAGRKGGGSPPYEEWTREELYERAKEIGIAGRSGMSKSQLISELRDH